jgi:hypothetical protein
MRVSRLHLILLAIIFLAACAPVQPTKPNSVNYHPDGPLFVGDQVSFEVMVPPAPGSETGSIKIGIEGQDLGTAGIAPYGIGGRNQATLWWIWNTGGLQPGSYTLSFTRLPENTTWTENITLLPANQVPNPEPDAHWVSTSTICCNLYYITGTAAERDIVSLSQEVERQSELVSAQLHEDLTERVNMIFMSRVVGHGGFTWSGVYVSYLDDNYIGNDMAFLFHHELVHYYDSALGGSYLPTMLQEGLAVYLTGGHFKPEALGQRAAALLNLGWYIPLTAIANDFYNQQHDISYLEASALIQYLVDTYGWDAFNQFYRNIPAPSNQTPSEVMDAALHSQFGLSFANLESAFQKYLPSQPVTYNERTDLELTVSFFDTVRRYQEELDPSAYFKTAWLPDGQIMRQRGIVSDFLRHPVRWENKVFESLLIRSQKALFSGEYKRAGSTLRFTNWLLNAYIKIRIPGNKIIPGIFNSLFGDLRMEGSRR